MGKKESNICDSDDSLFPNLKSRCKSSTTLPYLRIVLRPSRTLKINKSKKNKMLKFEKKNNKIERAQDQKCSSSSVNRLVSFLFHAPIYNLLEKGDHGTFWAFFGNHFFYFQTSLKQVIVDNVVL